MKIPLHRPYWGKQAEQAVIRAMRNGSGTADGPETATLREQLKKVTGAKYAIPVTSCTHAMEAAVAVLGAKTGDEVIVPSFTLSATATAAMIRGATPVFADIDPVTFSLDPEDVEKRITKRTVGILTVDYAGMAGKNLERLLGIAKTHKLWFMEDAAHCIGSAYKGKALGTFGIAGAFSFHGTKNVACGEGGAIITNSESLWERLEIFRSIGTDRVAFLLGKVSAYRWVGEGSSYMLSDLLASLLNVQLSQIPRINRDRAGIARQYNNALADYTEKVQLPTVPEGMTSPNWHIYALKLKTPVLRTKFIHAMREKHIEVSSHFMPLHSSPMGKRIARKTYALPVTEDVAETIVRMPIYAAMSKTELEYVIASARKILTSI